MDLIAVDYPIKAISARFSDQSAAPTVHLRLYQQPLIANHLISGRPQESTVSAGRVRESVPGGDDQGWLAGWLAGRLVSWLEGGARACVFIVAIVAICC